MRADLSPLPFMDRAVVCPGNAAGRGWGSRLGAELTVTSGFGRAVHFGPADQAATARKGDLAARTSRLKNDKRPNRHGR
jgi:hypothetical protein